MNDRDRILESLGLDLADGRKPDWRALEQSLDGAADLRLVESLRNLAIMADYYRAEREKTEAGRADPSAAGAVADPGRSTPEEGRADLAAAGMASTAGRGNAAGLERPHRLRPGTCWGSLEVLEYVGGGAHGEVYRARDVNLNREVALKLYSRAVAESKPPAATHIARDSRRGDVLEGERLARIKHPNLVTVYGARTADGRTGIWMEFLRGETLKEQIEARGPLSDREAARVGIDLCGALAALNGAGLLHRDIKAQNVVREAGGRIVLMDLASGEELRPGRTWSAPSSGTPLYMAPEVLEGAPASIRSDLYSLGVLLFHLVTGGFPVEAVTLEELREKHSHRDRRRLRDLRPDLSGAFVSAVERALSHDPEARPSSAGEMEQDLAGALGIGSRSPEHSPAISAGAAPPQNAAAPSGARNSPKRIALAAALIVLAAAIGGIAIFRPPWSGGPYSIRANLYRAGLSGPETLLPGARVTPGDRLWMEFQGSRELHVYVLAEDDRGEAYLLFPLPGHDLANPLPKGGPHRLPPGRNGQEYTWGVSSAGGTEHILVVASPEPLRDFETSLSALPLPRESATALPLDPEALSTLRGIGALVEATPPPSPGSASVFAAARSLGQGDEEIRGIWVRQIDLINPGAPGED